MEYAESFFLMLPHGISRALVQTLYFWLVANHLQFFVAYL